MPAVNSTARSIYFRYNVGDTIVFLYDIRLDPYTYVFAGQRAEIVSDGISKETGFPEARIRLNNSMKEFYVDQRFFITLDYWRELTRQVLRNLASSNVDL